MSGRLFWFALGAGLAVWGAGKLRRTAQRVTPEAIGHRAAESVVGLGESVRDFSDRVRAAMAEREAELRDVLRGGAGPRALGRPESE